ncbi:MAG: multidrug efflux SMR transporter, partial [Deltaproteobacteria bacterium]|nr:multidrug efflux SMR transporter [Deltaproteobacteria bacterium]
AYVHLGIAIVAEVVATSALKASAGFSQLIPSILVIGGYALAFYMLSIVVESIPVGIAYAVWAGVGVVLVAIAGAIVYRQIPDLAAIIGMALIVAGVVVMHLYSNSIGH